LSSSWNAAASEEFQAKFKQLYNDMDNVFTIISEYVNDLNDAADKYNLVNNQVSALVDALPVDGVFK